MPTVYLREDLFRLLIQTGHYGDWQEYVRAAVEEKLERTQVPKSSGPQPSTSIPKPAATETKKKHRFWQGPQDGIVPD